MRRSWRLLAGLTVAVAVLVVPGVSGAGADAPDTKSAARHAAASPAGAWVREALASTDDRDFFRFHLPARGRALVTLGHLPADYALTVYNDSGKRVGRSDHTGDRFEELYRSLPKGDVLVRVSSSHDADADSRYAVKFRPLDAGVVVAEQRNIGGSQGFDIHGELLNNSTDWLEILVIHVTWLDKNGKAVGTHDEGIVQSTVGPHRRVQFDVARDYEPSGDVPKDATHYRIRVDSKVTDNRTPSGIVVKPATSTETNRQRVYHGTVTNTSGKTAHGVYPTVIEYDAYGRAIAFGYGRAIQSLAPGETVNYTAAIDTAGLPPVNAARQFASFTQAA